VGSRRELLRRRRHKNDETTGSPSIEPRKLVEEPHGIYMPPVTEELTFPCLAVDEVGTFLRTPQKLQKLARGLKASELIPVILEDPT
jgi:hypothetical protein